MIDEHGDFATWFVAFLIMGKLWEIIDGQSTLVSDKPNEFDETSLSFLQKIIKIIHLFCGGIMVDPLFTVPLQTNELYPPRVKTAGFFLPKMLVPFFGGQWNDSETPFTKVLVLAGNSRVDKVLRQQIEHLHSCQNIHKNMYATSCYNVI